MSIFKTWLPCFPGFYETGLYNSGMREAARSGVISGLCLATSFPSDLLEYWIDHSGLTAGPELIEEDLLGYQDAVVEEFRARIANVLAGVLKSEVTITDAQLVCPRDYSQGNDSVNCTIRFDADKAVELLQKHRDKFAEYLKQNYTSRDGYMSWYSDDPDDWMDRKAWKGHEPGAVLQFLLLAAVPDIADRLVQIAVGNVSYADRLTASDELYRFLQSAPAQKIAEEYDRLEKQARAYIDVMPDKARARALVEDGRKAVLKSMAADLDAALEDPETAEIAG